MSTAWHWHVPDLISQDEEDELAAKSVQGDMEARAQLVISNLRLILFMASSFTGFSSEKQDLVGEGLLGAWTAANRYDPSYGVKFCTYATWWIRSYMVQHVKKSCRLLTYSPNMYMLNKELARSYALTGLGVEDDSILKDISDKFVTSPERIRKKLNSSVKKIYLDAPFAEGDSTLADVIVSKSRGPEEECVRKEIQTVVQSTAKLAMAVLTDKEACVVRMILMGDATFTEAGAKLGVSKQRAKQICDKAVKKMKRRLKHVSNFHNCFA